MLRLKRTVAGDADFIPLVALLDADLAVRDGDEHAFYAQFNKTALLDEVIVAYWNDGPVGCGAFKHFGDAVAEIKRMFVLPAFRGKGIASAILAALEQWAGELNYRSTILETGIKQPEAIALYTKAGYRLTANYGQYLDVENSVCMRKELKK
ncbi:MAG: family N-acetyltransferase [Ferruginibacter sp.]|nr:family N-acetyltransferase [Ferruginibacter sp.]